MSFQAEIFFENLLNGLTLGALYSLVTLGLVLTFSIIGIVNFAHGDLFMLAGYTFYLLINLPVKLPYLVITALVIILTAFYAMVIERLAIHPIINRSWRTHAITTIALSIILQNTALAIFSGDPRQTPTAMANQIVSPFGIRMSVQRLIILLVVIVVFIGLQLFVKRTKLGKTMRAISQNREMCQMVGINVRQIALITFALGGAITGLAAAMITPLFSVYTSMGSMLTIKSLAAIVIGGMGQVNGAIYASFLMGIIESFFGGYVSFAYKDAVSFGLFILVLFLRPRGLFGKKVGI